jgi:2-keto-4-pentenoate hydratase/2-oxohepta-3-ene-1,7-dioic acid hydratase in catechol pathway
MKLCRYDNDRLGVVIGDMVHDVTKAQDEIRAAAPYTMKGDAVIAALPEWRGKLEQMAKSAPGKPLSSVKLLIPVARPSKAMAAPTNYRDHIAEMAARRNEGAHAMPSVSPKIIEAGIFLKANSALVGPSEGIPLRFPERRNEHEAEICMIIGKKGTDIPKEKALDYVAGYCLGLDMTARGKEDRSFRKSIDGYAVLGPWMVTADEIADPNNLDFELTNNGETKQKANTKDLILNCQQLIEFATKFYTIYPGDIYYTGTPAGVSPVTPGDWIRMRATEPFGELAIQCRAHTPGQS